MIWLSQNLFPVDINWNLSQLKSHKSTLLEKVEAIANISLAALLILLECRLSLRWKWSAKYLFVGNILSAILVNKFLPSRLFYLYCRYGYEKRALSLVKPKFPLVRDNQGATAVHWACYHNMNPVINAASWGKEEFSLEDKQEKTPLDYAQRSKKETTGLQAKIEYILKDSADSSPFRLDSSKTRHHDPT